MAEELSRPAGELSKRVSRKSDTVSSAQHHSMLTCPEVEARLNSRMVAEEVQR